MGGIAKGYALDEALKVLHKHGLRQALVSAGGDIAAGDAPPGKPGWKIALLGLNENAAAEFIWVSNGAVATSGDLFQVLELDGKRHSHIIDPRTARAITEQRLVHVLALTAMQADSLATAISVLGHKDGMRLVSGGKKLGARVAYRDALGQVKEIANSVFRARPKGRRGKRTPTKYRRTLISREVGTAVPAGLGKSGALGEPWNTQNTRKTIPRRGGQYCHLIIQSKYLRGQECPLSFGQALGLG